MKILCWNLGFAHGRWHDEQGLHERAWHWIAAFDPDIAFLQETEPPAWADQRWGLVVGPHQLFASAILTRPEIELQPVTLPAGGVLDRFGAYLATVEIVVSNGPPVFISSVHTSARVAPERGHPGFDRMAISRASVGEPWWNDVAYAAYRELLADRRFILAGDWNISRWVDADGVPTHAGAEFFARAEDAGWVELSLDADGREGKTWYGSTNPRTHQPDHVFADPETAATLRSFAIEPWPVSALGLSDHAPLALELDLEAVTTLALGEAASVGSNG